MEQERRNLSERISNGQGKEPSSGPRGFIIGTFVQGRRRDPVVEDLKWTDGVFLEKENEWDEKNEWDGWIAGVAGCAV